jgi:hypothetical protein
MDGGLGIETVVVGEIKPYRVAAVYQSEAVSRLSFHENCAGAGAFVLFVSYSTETWRIFIRDEIL